MVRKILLKLKGREIDVREFGRLCKVYRAYDHEWFVKTAEVNLWRKLIRQDAKLHDEEGTWEQGHFHFKKTMADGSKKDFYQDWVTAEPQCKADTIKSVFDAADREVRKGYRMHDDATDRHGDEYTQFMFGYPLPDRPDDDDD